MFTAHTSLRFAALAAICASTASAHMQMSWPYPLHSTFNPKTPESAKDYSMTSPLITDGVYPCKGFINNPSGSPYMDSVVSWKAGQTVNVTLAGTATHHGGSCQFSMSYDGGSTWNVIQSYIGGCVTDSTTIDVAIPSEAPSGDALFAWTWFNTAGNREMYMNCAAVTVANGGSGLTGPTPFVANADVNECKTIENVDVVFPDPGSVIHFGGSYASSKPTTPVGYTGSNCVGPGATASYPTNSKASSAAPSSSSSPAQSYAQTTATAASTLSVHEKLVSTSDAMSSTESSSSSSPTSTDAIAQQSESSSSTGTASASAVTSTSTSKNGKTPPLKAALYIPPTSFSPLAQVALMQIDGTPSSPLFT
ncbi:hypothetical protein QFC19_006819 [Naganishia cerealis]|uniref:Uncharacterized protein n=1 Tax=Naganishia cerealis TaxID=610337 RepID=A0ACC2VET2_9TREE|nr:hypothetical protein QFC19_006819 [Naganishia cerealis]